MHHNHLLSNYNMFKHSFLPYSSIRNRKWDNIKQKVWVYTSRIVNLCYILNERNDIIMVDTGMPHCFPTIKKDFQKMFGTKKPLAIVLTHGHFDHVGSLAELLLEWNIPVFAHTKELPYLTGKADYPKGQFRKKGMVARLSRTFPNHGINIAPCVTSLPHDNSVPFLQDWIWLSTPGHTPGHISLYNANDRILIAGDAFVTTQQESLFHVITQKFKVSGPPSYFTMDEKQARKSIETLSHLNVDYCVTGHGLITKSRGLLRKELNHLLLTYHE
ncbi:MAG: MBL fold metallo-hydrolase [Bacillus sp. (in: firmicutes)]